MTTLDADIAIIDLTNKYDRRKQGSVLRSALDELKKNRFDYEPQKPKRHCPPGYDSEKFRGALYLYKATALSWVRANKGFANFTFANNNIPEELVSYIRVRLNKCRNKDNVKELFKAIDKSLRYDLNFL